MAKVTEALAYTGASIPFGFLLTMQQGMTENVSVPVFLTPRPARNRKKAHEPQSGAWAFC